MITLAKPSVSRRRISKVIEFSEHHNLHLRSYPYCMMFAPKANKTVALMTIWPRDGFLETGVWFEVIEKI